MQFKILTEPVLVGRGQELAELERYLELAAKGKGSTIFISGEAGSGKTRLLTEFLNKARQLGVTTLTGWCLSNAAVPYFPFFEAFRTYFSEVAGEDSTEGGKPQEDLDKPENLELKDWLLGPAQTERTLGTSRLSPQAWKDQTFAAVARTLTSITSKKPVVLFIDDAHWADSASLALIHYIARIAGSMRVLVLATFRSEQLVSDAEGRPHPLAEILLLMRREDLFKEIKLASLSQTGVSELAKSMLDGGIQQQFAEKLMDESQGNPLFVVESLRMLHERCGLIRDRGQWRLASDEIGIPEKIKDIILLRLGALSRNQRRVLEAASVIGEKFNVGVLASLLSQDSLEVLETLDVVQKETSLVLSEGELYRFDHARSRDAIYDEISASLKKGYHAKLAEKLETTSGKGKPPFSEIAHHYVQAGNMEKAVKFALAAGQDALASWSNMEAIKQFTYVLRAVAEDSEHSEEKLSAMEGLGDAYLANSECKEAIEAFEHLGDVAAGIVKLRAYRKAMDAAFQLGDASRLMGLVKKAMPYAAVDRLENARVLFARGRASHLLGDFQTTMRDSEAALQVFEEEYSLWDIASVLLGLGAYRAIVGMLKEGLAECLRAVALFEELGDLRWEMEACWVGAMPFLGCLLTSEGLQMLAKVIEIDEKMKMGDYLHLVYANVVLGRSFLDFKMGLAYSLKALEFSKKTDAIIAHGMVYSTLTNQYTNLGDLKQAEKYYEELLKLPREIFNHPLVSGSFAIAVYLAGKKQWKESNQAFKEIYEQSAPPFYVKMAYAWALEKQGRFEEAKVQREESQAIIQKMEEMFEHADLQAHLMARRQVAVGEEFEMRFDLVNVGRKPALLVEIKNTLPNDFKVSSSTQWCNIQNGAIKMKNKEIGAFQVNTAILTVKCLKAGSFILNPQAVYVDDVGETKTCILQPVTITVNPPAPQERVAGKISSGTPDLDHLLLGGIPENYAIILTAPSSDERALLIKRFLTAGAETDETTFYITAEAENVKILTEKNQNNFYLFLCNPRADAIIENLPNVFKLKGVENLTEIDIALTKAFRTLSPSTAGARRIYIETISDILLQHHAVTTRRWLSALLPTLKSKGFTILAVIDPGMHPAEETQAVLGLFDGEISIHEKETPKGTARFLKIKRMTGQRYLKDEIPLTEE